MMNGQALGHATQPLPSSRPLKPVVDAANFVDVHAHPPVTRRTFTIVDKHALQIERRTFMHGLSALSLALTWAQPLHPSGAAAAAAAAAAAPAVGSALSRAAHPCAAPCRSPSCPAHTHTRMQAYHGHACMHHGLVELRALALSKLL